MGVNCSAENKRKVNKENKDKNKSNSNKETKDKNTKEDATKNNKNKEGNKNENIIENPESKKNAKNAAITIDSNVYITRGAISPDKVYTIEGELGKGSFGTVNLVKHKQLGRYFAMKVISKKHRSKEEEKEIMNEIEILKSLDHPCILKIVDFYNQKNEYDIVVEYCKEGELYNEIKAYAPFPEPITAYYMKQILNAVYYCHSKNIIHRDLKPENILIVKRQKNGFHSLKIIDFGTATVFKSGEKENLLIGSAYYIAPEVLSCNYNEKSDLWSCGVIMYILLTGRPPFGGSNDEEIIKKIKKGKYDLYKYPWGSISNDAKDLVSKLIEPNQNKRLSAKDALLHKWFRNEKIKKTENKINKLDSKAAMNLVENLRNYKCNNILQAATVAYLVHTNTQLEQAIDAVKLFNKIDSNSDGKIIKEELYNGLQFYLKISADELKKQVDEIFNRIDTDHNGYIEYEEFIRAAINKKDLIKTEYLKYAFDFFDQDRSGEISLEEVKNVFIQSNSNNRTPDALKQLKESFASIDINKDGVLNFDEFQKMMVGIINS